MLAYVNELRSQGLLNTHLIHEQYKPHISLAIYPELEQKYSEKVLQILAARFAQFRLNFSHIGIFNAELKVLYLGPTFSAALRDIHNLLHTLYLDSIGICIFWDLYSTSYHIYGAVDRATDLPSLSPPAGRFVQTGLCLIWHKYLSRITPVRGGGTARGGVGLSRTQVNISPTFGGMTSVDHGCDY